MLDDSDEDFLDEYEDYRYNVDSEVLGMPSLRDYDKIYTRSYPEVDSSAVLAIHQYNQLNRSDFKFIKVQEFYRTMCSGYIYEVTFEAACEEGCITTFEGSIWLGVGNRGVFREVRYCDLLGKTIEETTKRARIEYKEEMDATMLEHNHDWLPSCDGVANVSAYKEYKIQVQASNGFDVGFFPPLFVGQIRPLEDVDSSHYLFGALIQLALGYYEGKVLMESLPRYKLLVIEKLNVQTNEDTVFHTTDEAFRARNTNLYITFLVENEDTGFTETFQTLIWKRMKIKEVFYYKEDIHRLEDLSWYAVKIIKMKH